MPLLPQAFPSSENAVACQHILVFPSRQEPIPRVAEAEAIRDGVCLIEDDMSSGISEALFSSSGEIEKELN